MIDPGGLAVACAGLVGAGTTGLKACKLIRAFLRERAVVQIERERSARTKARVDGLIRLADHSHSIRVHELDHDGNRVIEIGITSPPNREVA